MLPVCPHCKKNDKVFASHMFGKKDLVCVRCKRTFIKPPRRPIVFREPVAIQKFVRRHSKKTKRVKR